MGHVSSLQTHVRNYQFYYWEDNELLIVYSIFNFILQSVYTPKNLADAHIPMRPAPNGNFVRDLPKFDDATAFKDHYK